MTRGDMAVIVILGCLSGALFAVPVPDPNSDALAAIIGGLLGYLTRQDQGAK